MVKETSVDKFRNTWLNWAECWKASLQFDDDRLKVVLAMGTCDKPIVKSDIYELCSVKEEKNQDGRKLRMRIEVLNRLGKGPYGGIEDGYFQIRTKKELDIVIHYRQKKIAGALDMIKVFHYWDDKLPDGEEPEPEPEPEDPIPDPKDPEDHDYEPEPEPGRRTRLPQHDTKDYKDFFKGLATT